MPKQPEAPFAVPPVAFICALVGAPLIVAFFGFWILLIPVVALYFGGPVYLIFAGPTFYWYLKRRAPKIYEVMLLALSVNTIIFLVLLSICSVFPDLCRTSDILVLYGGFGSVMSVIWGAVFCKLYVSFSIIPNEIR